MKKIIYVLLLCVSLTACSAQETTTETKPSACDPTEVCASDETTDEGFTEITMDEALSYFEGNASAVLFFGFNDCPWCKEARPILKEVASNTDREVYYVKVRDDDSNLLYTDQQREQLTKYIPDYMSKNKDQNNKLWLYVPLVIRIDDGKVIGGHQGTVDGHDATKRTMTSEEQEQLRQTYQELLSKTTES